MEPCESLVELQHDHFVRVPAQTPLGSPEPLDLRPGSDDSRVRLKVPGLDIECSIDYLRQGLDLIEEEHRR